jgi:succinate dehydrogenase and fumarate reductase iron-sulfur protein
MPETTFIIKRYNPEKGVFYTSEYKVPYESDTTILSGLIYIKDYLDRTLSFRYSCRMASCGSCGMVVNKKPTLVCRTLIESVKKPIYIEPLYNFPIIKDLVVDIDIFLDKLKFVKSYIIREKEEDLDKEYIVKPEQLDLIKHSSSCINCMLCYAACPVFGSDEEFIGPAALAILYRYLHDPRDQAKSERIKIASLKNSAYMCSMVGQCTVVCPKGVDPSFHIQRLKVISTLNNLFS